jgi:lipoyl(octanoyl) transferase
MLEQSVIDLLVAFGVVAERRSGAPGVYVADAKVAALGLRVSRGRAYMGLHSTSTWTSLTFASIDPCGFQVSR